MQRREAVVIVLALSLFVAAAFDGTAWGGEAVKPKTASSGLVAEAFQAMDGAEKFRDLCLRSGVRS